MKRIICIFILFSISYVLYAQGDSDSLLKIWNDTSIEDTVRADALRGYIYQKHLRSNIDSAIILADEHLAFSKKVNNGNTILSSYLINSMVNTRAGNYDKAIGFSFEALNDTLCEKKWSCQSTFYNVLGNVYTLMNVPKKALVQYRKALNLNVENSGDSSTIGFLYSNIGNIYHDINKDSALYFFNKSLKIQTELEDDFRIAQVNWNIGRAHSKTPKKAVEFYKKSYVFFKKTNYSSYLATLANNISLSYLRLDNLAKASDYAVASLKYADQSKSRLELKNAYSTNFKIQEIKNNYADALKYYEQSIMIKDSLNRQSNIKALHEAEIKYEYEKKNSADSIFYAEEQKIADAKLDVLNAELRSQNRMTNGIIFILFLIVVFAIIIWLRFQKNQQEKDIIQEQKQKMDNAYQDLEIKKVEIEKKNKEIIDSIHYARYIQKALQPNEDEIASFFGNHAIFNFPKDIVGGDFYWFKTFGDIAIAIAADCTGHGVPGGFLTVLGNLIIETIAANKTMSPNDILSKINQELVLILNQKKDNSIQDGMDLAICVINKKSKKVVFSGARNGVYIVSNTGYLKQYKGDYTPVGGSYFKKEKLEERRYTAHEFSLKKGEWLFMYSDGYYDQFGGTKNKSMGVNKFKNILCESIKHNNDLNVELKKEFLNWKGNNNQLDDVLVFGFTI